MADTHFVQGSGNTRPHLRRNVSQERFAALVQERLIDATEVAEMLGFRQTQSVFDGVERGKIPAPIIKRQRAHAFWDRLAIEPLTRR